MSLKLAGKNRSASERSYQQALDNAIESKIRKRYSVGNELAILRQRDDKPEEFAAYNAYVEQCKAEAKEELNK